MSIENIRLGIVGATGAVGREVIEILHERNLVPKHIELGASAKSAGETISFFDQDIVVKELSEAFFKDLDVVIASAGSSVSKNFTPLMIQNAIIIDNCSYFRMDPDVPLVIPEVNGMILEQRPPKNIIANPNCTTTAMLMALAPIYHEVGLESVICSTYQSVSGAGQKGMDELGSQIQDMFSSKEVKSETFSSPIAFNMIPNIGGFLPGGATVEEQKMVDETQKILQDPSIALLATCVRVPTFVGHGISLYIETKDPTDVNHIRSVLSQSQGVTLVDAPDQDVYPVLSDCHGQDDVYVGRIRQGLKPNSISLWLVSDNLRKGAALNTVQILEQVAGQPWLKN